MGNRCSKCSALLYNTSNGAVCEDCGNSYTSCEECGGLAPEYFIREVSGKSVCSSYCEDKVKASSN